MTIIKEDFTDIALVGADVTVSFHGRPIRPASTATGLVTPKQVSVRAMDGKITSPELDPGPCEVLIETGRWKREYCIVVPATSTHRLRDLIEAYEIPDPPVVSLVKLYRDETKLARDIAVAAAEGVAGISDDLAQVAEDRAAAEDARNKSIAAQGLSERAASSAERDAAVATGAARESKDFRDETEEFATAASESSGSAAQSESDARQALADSTTQAKRSEDAAEISVEQAVNAEQYASDAKQFRDEAQGVVTGVSSFEGVSGAVTKAQVGLDLVDNTRDADKPISTATQDAFDYLSAAFGVAIGDINTDLAAKLDAAQVQTIANAAAAAIVDGSPEALDTLVELAAALGNDPNFATTVTNLIGQKAASDDPRFTDARTPKGTTRAVWNAGTADSANLGLTPAELKEAVVTHIGTTDPKPTIGGAAIIKAGTVPYDITYAAQAARRVIGYGDMPAGISLRRAVTFTELFVHCETADASGNLVVELRKNGTAVPGTSTTIAAANQVTGGTTTGSWSFAPGDVLSVYVANVGSTPGKGLVMDLKGVA